MTTRYVPLDGLSVEAEQYAGTNQGALEALIPPGIGRLESVYRDASLILIVPGRQARLVHVGDWLSWNGTGLTVHSHDSFSSFWRKAPGQP